MEITLIGIGSGNPEHLTGAAIGALAGCDLVLIPSKSDEKQELAALRQALCDMHLPRNDARIRRFEMPVRDPAIADYLARVEAWHDAIAAAWLAAIPTDTKRVALLIWGDPSLFDSSLRIAARLKRRGDVVVKVIPGVTSLQLLTAAHAVPLNDLGAPVLITTGRQLREGGWPACVDTVAVMLDGECSFQGLCAPGIHIWWGAYLGMKGEILIQGPLPEVASEIVAARSAAREQRGWIMDIYLLKRSAA